MAAVTAAAELHYQEVQRLQVLALAATRRAWASVNPTRISESWTEALSNLVPVVSGAQFRAASSAVTYGAFALAEQGVWVAPTAFADPAAFADQGSYGDPLASDLYSAAPHAKQLIARGVVPIDALASAKSFLEMTVRTSVTDAARKAASVDIATRPGVGYVRMLNPPSCEKCVVLAGKFYRWNAGFRRHPRCDCVHVPSTVGSTQGALDEGLVDDPYQYFHSLTPAEQDRIFGKGYSDAIRDGGDIYQVVNSKRGRVGVFTTEGITRRGNASTVLRPRQRRMTPDTIYRLAKGDRAAAIADLRAQGYILPGGQVPGGSLRGRVEGYGQMGHGGARKAASQAIEEARRTGIRDPTNRYTMTAAERRLYDAEQSYRAVLQGYGPGSASAFTNIPDPTGLRLSYGRSSASGRTAPATPLDAARAEATYRRWLATGGQKF